MKKKTTRKKSKQPVKELLLRKRRVPKAKLKTGIKSIRIMRVEGKIEECGKWHHFKTLARANALLSRNSRTAPKGGAYDKHDFEVKFKDGSVYKGRYDLHRNEAGDLKGHMLGFVNYIISKKFSRHKYIKPKERAAQRREARKIKRQLVRI